ncbi:MAG: hypothetical protein LH615_11375 [Ferruginibacter sp.]|nr:hypothetical protein [Ferruginibacter sp.]
MGGNLRQVLQGRRGCEVSAGKQTGAPTRIAKGFTSVRYDRSLASLLTNHQAFVSGISTLKGITSYAAGIINPHQQIKRDKLFYKLTKQPFLKNLDNGM